MGVLLRDWPEDQSRNPNLSLRAGHKGDAEAGRHQAEDGLFGGSMT